MHDRLPAEPRLLLSLEPAPRRRPSRRESTVYEPGAYAGRWPGVQIRCVPHDARMQVVLLEV